MTSTTSIKLALAAIGVAIFFYAHQTGDDRLRFVAIGFLVSAFLLRFWKGGGGKQR